MNGSGTLTIYSFPNDPVIAGDGFAYATYITDDATDNRPTTPQPYTQQIYDDAAAFSQALDRNDVGASINTFVVLNAALGGPNWLVATGEDLCVGSGDPNCQPSISQAKTDLGAGAWRLGPLQNYSKTDVYRMHILRVGTDGSFSDVVVKEWRYSDQRTYTLVEDPAYHSFQFSQVTVGSPPQTPPAYRITDADHGAVFSWGVSVPQYCPAATEAGCSVQVVPPSGEYHLTRMAGGAVAADVVWDVPGLDAVNYWQSAVLPVLQLQDGSYVGQAYTDIGLQMLNFDQSGHIKWSVPGDGPSMALADGTIVGTSGATYDQNGGVTGQAAGSNTMPAWTGSSYSSAGAAVASVVETPPLYAPTYAAVSGGNQSGNSTAIVQVQAKYAQQSTHQLPSANATLHTNYNSIEIYTSLSPDFIFSHYIQTFAGAMPDTNDVASTSTGTNVTAPGQKVTFTLGGLMALGQAPFSVESERVDVANDTLSVVTLTGHPLAGWRYWRAYSVDTNDVVIETGAIDTNAPGLLNWAGYWVFRSQQTKMWKEYMQYILFNIREFDHAAVEGGNPFYNIVNGLWDPPIPTHAQILQNVCQLSACN